VKGRWHDNRHTLATELAESGAGEQTVMDIAGHVTKQRLKHYSHIRMQANRKALNPLVMNRSETRAETRHAHDRPGLTVSTRHYDGNYPKTPHNRKFLRFIGGCNRSRKSRILIGSSGRTRINGLTYFQQHAGQRMTLKTSQNSGESANGAHLERRL
jgi:hypothetical protein